jgi:hypothetical protein
MKTIIKTLCFCTFLNATAQKNETEKKKIEPFIISTEVFAPLSIGVEKVFASQHAIKLRYFHLFPESDNGFGYNSFDSYMVQYKYYLKKIEQEKVNICIGVYSKFKRSLEIPDFYNGKKSNDVILNENLFFGIHGGFHYIVGSISLEANAGLGVNTLYKPTNGLSPYDARANFAVGFVIY